ncbi:MAG: DUF502 domain-containing protein, partial [Alphaproteobacteria bacterium]|nr:DUF502 domain-containing protein [Alphaproteobacteria bacterium]
PLLPDIFPFTLPGSGLVLLFLILLVMGFATSNFLGKNFVKLYDYGFGKLPLVGDVYLGIKGTLKNFTSEGAQSFSEAVLVEYPRDGFWSLGFITGQAAGEWQKKLGRGFVIVFIPFGPVPPQGALCITKRNKLIKLDMKSQEAIGYVVSLGAAHKMEIVEKNKPILLDKKMLKGLVYGGKKNRPTKTKRRS